MRRQARAKQETHRTYGGSRAVRLPDFDYAADVPTHLTICTERVVTADQTLARMICENVEFYCRRLQYCPLLLLPDAGSSSRVAVARRIRNIDREVAGLVQELYDAPVHEGRRQTAALAALCE